MKNKFSTLFTAYLLLAATLFSQTANVTKSSATQNLTAGFNTGANTLNVSAGGVINTAAGTLTVNDLTTGIIRWNDTDKCIEWTTAGGTVIQGGQEITIYARNNTGSTLANGTPVYVTGATGNRPTLAKADADTQATAQTLIGLVTTDAGIPNNNDGFVTVFGSVRNLDTSSYSEGVTLWLGDGTAGTLTVTKPTTESSYVTKVGVVTNAHATQGEILVTPHYHGSVTGDAVMNAVSKAAARTAIAADEQIKSANFTAVAGESYVVTASATVTDPSSPVNGQSYRVRVSAGTATVGGLNYTLPNLILLRAYNGSAWSTYEVPTSYSNRIENRQALRDFSAALYEYAQNDTTNISIAYYGDSVASLVSEEFIRLLNNSNYPRADLSYPSAMQAALDLQVVSGTLTYNGSTAVVQAGNNDGAGGFANFTYTPTAGHLELPDGLIMTFGNANGFTGRKTAKILFATGPTFGSAFIELINRQTAAVVDSVTVNLNTGALGGAKAEFNLDEATSYYMRVTSTGVSVIVHAVAQKAKGVSPLALSCGGSTLEQNNYANATIFEYICTELNVRLIFLSAKEEFPTTNIAPAMTRIGLIDNASKFVVSSLPDSSNSQLIGDPLFRYHSLASGYAYADGYAFFGSRVSNAGYAELLRLGWISDGTHPLTPANRYVASLLMSEFSDLLQIGGQYQNSVNASDSGKYVKSGSFRVPTGNDNPTTYVEFAKTYGGAAPTKALLKNIERIFFDNDGTTKAVIGPYDASLVTVLNTGGGIGGMYLSQVYAIGTQDNAVEVTNGSITVRAAGKGVRYGSSGTVIDTFGSGTPEGSISANIGSTYRRTDGGAGTSFYVKESGSGNTGWVGK